MVQLPATAAIEYVAAVNACLIYIISYVAAEATYIRLLHGKIGIFGGFFGPISVQRGRTHIVLGRNM